MAGQSHSEHPHERAPLPDDTPPRNGLIAMYTVLGVATLFSLHFVFSSYFTISAEGVVYSSRLSAPATELREMRADEAARAERGAMPVRRAMEQLARSGRVSSTINPMPSDDVGSLEGWAQDMHPDRAAAARAAMAAVAADAGAALETAVDGGAAIAPDAGAATPVIREIPTTRETPEAERPPHEAEAHPPRAPRPPRATPAAVPSGGAPVEPPPPAAPPAEQPTN